jgi:hypothetical protein
LSSASQNLVTILPGAMDEAVELPSTRSPIHSHLLAETQVSLSTQRSENLSSLDTRSGSNDICKAALSHLTFCPTGIGEGYKASPMRRRDAGSKVASLVLGGAKAA